MATESTIYGYNLGTVYFFYNEEAISLDTLSVCHWESETVCRRTYCNPYAAMITLTEQNQYEDCPVMVMM